MIGIERAKHPTPNLFSFGFCFAWVVSPTENNEHNGKPHDEKAAVRAQRKENEFRKRSDSLQLEGEKKVKSKKKGGGDRERRQLFGKTEGGKRGEPKR